MELVEIKNKSELNDFVSINPASDILQFWEWGETKKIEGWNPYRFGIYSDKKLLLVAQVLVKKVKILGSLVYVPHGPVLNYESANEDLINEFTKQITNWAVEQNAFIIEIEPKINLDQKERLAIYQKSGWRVSGRNRQPKYKLFIDLSKSDDEILADMKKNTRYNISYAQKKGVVVNRYNLSELSQNDTNALLDKFYDLILKMQERASGYPVRSKEYFNHLINSFKDTDNIMIFESVYQGDTIAMNISEYTQSWGCSFYAGSDFSLHPKVKAPYVLRWESILEAKKRGCKIYSFWGIVPDSKHHKGYSDHKISFGGYQEEYAGILTKKINAKALVWEVALKFMNFKNRRT